MVKRMIVVVAVFLLAISTTAYAKNTSVGVRGSLLGIGIEAERTLTDSIGIRGGVNYFTYSYTATESDIEYDFDLDLLSAPILVDWHPFKGSFRISGGALFNGNEIKSKAKPLSGGSLYQIGDSNYNATQVGTLTSKIDFNDIAPYLSLGVDTSFGKERGFGFVFEIGMVFQGKPTAKLSATGTLKDNAAFQSNLQAEETALQDDLDSWQYWPVLAFGVSYRF